MVLNREHSYFSKIVSKRLKRNRERKNLSFVIVILFFVIFCIIVLTEILVMEDRNKLKPFTISHKKATLDYDERQIVYEDAELYRDGLLDSKYRSDKLFPKISSASNLQSVLPSLNNLTARDAVWQSVPGTRLKTLYPLLEKLKRSFKFYIYSAHLDDRKSRKIRVIGASKTRSTEKVCCRYWYENSSKIVVAKTKVIRENWNMKYSAIFILCPLDVNVTVPNTISIIHKLKYPIKNHLIVRNNQNSNSNNEQTNQKESMLVCVKPLHFTYDKVLQMLEFLELNKLLGIDHINFYINSVSDEINCLLNQYKNSSHYISTYQWHLNMVSQKEIRTEGLFAALNDCLYRNMYLHKYIVFIDLDEFIIPKHNNTLKHLIDWLSKHLSTHTIGSYSFQNAFFYLQWPNDESLDSNNQFDTSLVTIAKTKRRAKLHPHKQRSKYIIRPEYVVEVGNHFVWEFTPGHGSINVPQNTGILHHYRICEFGGNDCIKQKYTVDKTAHRYRTQLETNVERVYNLYKNVCNLKVF